MTTWLACLGRIAHSTASGFSLAAPQQSRTEGPNLSRSARMAVKLGVPIESLNCLGALLHPDVVERVIDSYWQKNGDEPKTGTIDLGWKILRMAQRDGLLGPVRA